MSELLVFEDLSVDQSSIFSYEEEDRLGISTISMDGFSSGDGDGPNSPIDLICQQQTANDVTSSDDERSPLGWPLARQHRSHLKLSPANDASETLHLIMPFPSAWAKDSNKTATGITSVSEAETMKERFATLLLGEDTSGSGKGVCTALAISNALTNLSASVFGELWRLQPLSAERKAMWTREMGWLLSVCDYIVEFVPSYNNSADGSSLDVMVSRPRSDLHINLPALRKLDAMLLEALNSYKETEFWYVDQGVSVDAPMNQNQVTKREEDKWWLPVPKVPAGGMSEMSRKALQNQRDCTSQMLKAAMAINEQVLTEMQVPEAYWHSLPKSARVSLGESIYCGLRQEHLSLDALLSSLDLSTEHSALEVANRIQSAIHIWRRKEASDHGKKSNSSKPWFKVRDLVTQYSDKRKVLIERADGLLLSLRQRFPGLPQTMLDASKIQDNKVISISDVGQAILESYSRVLESLAFSILSRIEDVLYIADMTKKNQGATISHRLGGVSFTSRLSVFTSTPFVTPFASPSSSPSLSPTCQKHVPQTCMWYRDLSAAALPMGRLGHPRKLQSVRDCNNSTIVMSK